MYIYSQQVTIYSESPCRITVNTFTAVRKERHTNSLIAWTIRTKNWERHIGDASPILVLYNQHRIDAASCVSCRSNLQHTNFLISSLGHMLVKQARWVREAFAEIKVLWPPWLGGLHIFKADHRLFRFIFRCIIGVPVGDLNVVMPLCPVPKRTAADYSWPKQNNER